LAVRNAANAGTNGKSRTDLSFAGLDLERVALGHEVDAVADRIQLVVDAALPVRKRFLVGSRRLALKQKGGTYQSKTT
jgi:hypothetical protein